MGLFCFVLFFCFSPVSPVGAKLIEWQETAVMLQIQV